MLRAVVLFAVLGVLVPIGLLVADHMSPHGWWPGWIKYVWPTDFMLGATGAIVDRVWFEIAAVSISINAALYVIVGTSLIALGRKLLAPRSL